MTIDEAIEVQEQSLKDDQFFLPDDLQEAMRLGIEVLDRFKWLRSQLRILSTTRLPGETKD